MVQSRCWPVSRAEEMPCDQHQGREGRMCPMKATLQGLYRVWPRMGLRALLLPILVLHLTALVRVKTVARLLF